MILVSLEPVLAMLAQSLTSEVAKTATQEATGWVRGPRQRSRRLAQYNEFQVVSYRTHLRIKTLLAVQQARQNPFDVAAVLGGYPTAVAALDRVVSDLSVVWEAWHRVHLVAPEPVHAGADEVITALADLLAHVDPGWHKPRQRAAVKRRAREAEERFIDAATRFGRLALADSAARRRDRRAAQRRVSSPKLSRAQT